MARMRFTARAVQGMVQGIKTPESGRVEYFDETTAGFGVRVSSSGRRSWFVMFRCEGRLERLTIGPAGDEGLSLADARARAKEALQAAAKGRNLAEEKRRGRRAKTFRELADRYIEEYAKPNKRSWWRDKEILERDVERAAPPGKVVHAILDNYATHKHPKVQRWLADHPRWVSTLPPPRRPG